MWKNIWNVIGPILKNPGTWAAIIAIAGALFGVPGTGLLAPAPKVSLPAEASVKPMGLLQLPASHTGSNIDWDHDAPDATMFPLQDGSVVMQFPTAGKYRVHAHVARAGKLAHACTHVTVGDSPIPPVPPGPNPPPPPVPPPPPPAPIPAKGLHVLIVIDAENASKMPKEQLLALSADSVRQYMQSVSPGQMRIFAADGDVSHESQLWQDAFKRAAGKSLPWIIVSNPDKGGGFEGPLPADTDSLLALLKKYGS